MHRKHKTRLIVISLCSLAFISINAAPASAAGAFFDKPQRYSFEFSFPECDDQVQINAEGNGVGAAKNVRGSDGQAFLAMDTYRITETWTDNSDNHLMTVKFSGSFRETSATLVDLPPGSTNIDGDPIVGPVYEFKARDNFQVTLTLADGSRYRGVAQLDGALVFDTLGDYQPGGVPVDYAEEIKWAQFSPILDEDWCALALSQSP